MLVAANRAAVHPRDVRSGANVSSRRRACLESMVNDGNRNGRRPQNSHEVRKLASALPGVEETSLVDPVVPT